MEIEIIDYEPRYKEDFKRLNMEWISKYFEIEPFDLRQLNHPEEYIISNGGRIYFAKLENEIVGTVALKKVTDTVFELSKMGVSPNYQGKGIGKKLGQQLIEDARDLGCKLLFLESNQKLIPAINLYRKLGFIEVPIGNSPYSRADFRAEINF